MYLHIIHEYITKLIKLHKVTILSRLRTLKSSLGQLRQTLTNLKRPTSNRINQGLIEHSMSHQPFTAKVSKFNIAL